jgi:hypothetical protein
MVSVSAMLLDCVFSSEFEVYFCKHVYRSAVYRRRALDSNVNCA